VCDEKYIKEQIRLNERLVDAIIISGGEFLINEITDIENFLCDIKNKIIINTNGSYPDKMEYLISKGLVDGFHTDMKLPYHLLDCHCDKDLIELIVGRYLSESEISRFISSLEITVKTDKGYNQIRSVKYPFMDDSAFNENRRFIDGLNKKYNKNTPYYINDFIEGDDDDKNNML